MAADRRVYVLPVQWLANLFVVIRAGQVLHRDHLQGVLPGGVGGGLHKVQSLPEPAGLASSLADGMR